MDNLYLAGKLPLLVGDMLVNISSGSRISKKREGCGATYGKLLK